MTDDFEELVRSAGRSMTQPEAAPSYHDAWQRGRRRRHAKRSVVAAVGALVLFVAFSASTGRLPGGQTVETDDLATEAIGVPDATAPVFEPTATPTGAPTTEAVAESAAGSAPDLDIDGPTAEQQADEPTATPSTPATPTSPPSTPAEPTAVPPTAVPDVPRPTTAPAPTPTAAPTAERVPTPTPEPTLPPVETFEAPTSVPDEDASDPGPDDPPLAATGPAEIPTPTSSTDPVDGANPDPPERAFGPADAVVLPDDAPPAAGARCDATGDGVADARCRLLPSYACAGDGDVRDGYLGLDLSGDGAIDTCEAAVSTSCDVDGDGIGDLPCLITRVQTLTDDLPTEGP